MLCRFAYSYDLSFSLSLYVLLLCFLCSRVAKIQKKSSPISNRALHVEWLKSGFFPSLLSFTRSNLAFYLICEYLVIGNR